MNWYQVLTAIEAHTGPVLDLSTGSPLLVEEMGHALSKSLKTLADRDDLSAELGGYTNPDGLPDLINAFADVCTKYFGRRLDEEQIVVVPGIQAALRYAQEILRQRRESQRILYPIGLEFPGSIDTQSQGSRAIGRHQVANTSNGLFRPVIDHSSLDWKDVGAVIISSPHSPTGCFWSAEEMSRLADEAAAHGAWLILDETYALPFAPLSDRPYSFVDGPNVIHLYSFSKVGLAGERIGLVVGPSEIVRLFRGALRRNAIQTSKSGQRLALAVIDAIQSQPELGKTFGTLYRERWELCRRLLSTSEIRARIAVWEGGPFLWCEWSGGPSSDEMFSSLLDAGVAVAPSSALWVNDLYSDERPEGIRIGLGSSIADLEEALPIVAGFLCEPLRSSAPLR
jgi:valine--pyruvate aminotransferase